MNALFAGDFTRADAIKNESIPKKLYKFISLGESSKEDEKRLETLGSDELWFSPASMFNDSYECKIYISMIIG